VRRIYEVSQILINGILIEAVVIDAHVEKHSDHIDDLVILSLVESLHGKEFMKQGIKQEYQYFESEVFLDNAWYKLIWLLEKGHHYVGVITAFRDRRIK
jgi:hypothetical protein